MTRALRAEYELDHTIVIQYSAIMILCDVTTLPYVYWLQFIRFPITSD